MINIIKITICVISLAFATITPVLACTGVIVGSDASEDGNYIFGRTEDLEVNHNKVFKIHNEGTYKKGDKLKDISYDPDLGYEYEFKADSFKFTSVSDTTPEYGIFDEAGFNDKGLIADMTVSASANEEVLTIDPYLDGSDTSKNVGISEAIITTVVLSSNETAKQAVEFIANEVALNGSAEGNGLVVADKKEVWYMEIYTGHQFVAMRYPKDKFSVFPNAFWLNKVVIDTGEVNDNYIISKDSNFIYSKGIFETAIQAKTFVGNEDIFEIDLVGSYGSKQLSDSNRSRVCSGILQLNEKAKVNMESDIYPFLQDVNEKITLEDVMEFTKNRLENVNIEADDLSKDGSYPIGNRNTMEAHIFQLNKDNPQDYPGSMWLALGSPLTSLFVEYYPNQTKSISQTTNESNEFVEDSVYWIAMDILHMVEVNRKEFMPIVDSHLENVQKLLINNSNNSKLSSEESDKLNIENAQLGYDTMLKLRDELKVKYEEFLNNNDYETIFKARRSTIDYEGSKINVQKGTYNSKVFMKVNTEENIITLVDAYGNPIEKISKPVKFFISKKPFENEVRFLSNGTPIESTLNNDLYEFETDSTTINIETVSQVTTPVEVETKSKNNMAYIAIGFMALVLGIYIYKTKKTKN